jgi:peroxiredoxin
VVGGRYEVTRAPDEKSADFPLRIAYLIDPTGIIRQAYQVSDVTSFADQVLADLAKLTASS